MRRKQFKNNRTFEFVYSKTDRRFFFLGISTMSRFDDNKKKTVRNNKKKTEGNISSGAQLFDFQKNYHLNQRMEYT